MGTSLHFSTKIRGALITKSIYRTKDAVGKGREEEKEQRYSSIHEEGLVQFYRTLKVHIELGILVF